MVASARDWPDFTRAMLLVGVDAAGDPVGVLVDEDGNLNAILKGQGATGLQTIAVDEQGRIEVFILDAQSQWGKVLRVGNAELAARLGSSKSWDWRGDVYYHNDFSKGTGNILKYHNGTGSGIVLDPSYWVNGGFSLKLTGGSDGDGDAYIEILVDHPPSAMLGLEAHVSGNITFEYLYIRLQYYKDNKVYYAGLRVLPPGAPDIEYLNSAGVWTQIGDSFFGTAIEAFNHLKIVVDFDTFKYVRAMWGHTEYDLSAQSIQQSGAGYLDQVIARVYLKSTAAANESRYLDYVTLTVNEPS